MGQTKVADKSRGAKKYYSGDEEVSIAADPVVQYAGEGQLDKMIVETRKEMEKAAKDLNFIEAARLRDEMQELERLKKERK
jgi:excinuclease ABC subunit B